MAERRSGSQGVGLNLVGSVVAPDDGIVFVSTEAGQPWQATLARALIAANVEVAVWVPDKRLAPIAGVLASGGLQVRTLTREEECIGYAAGFRAAGGMPVVLLQSSGLGNSLNALGSLAIPYGLGFPIVVSMRGSLGERNPSQVPMGRATIGILGMLGIQCLPISAPGDIQAVVRGAVDLSQGARQVAAMILQTELEP